jgi:hypothetical protein
MLASCAFTAPAAAQTAVLDTDVNIAEFGKTNVDEQQPAAASKPKLNIGAAIEVMQGLDDQTIVTPQFNWGAGDCGGFGFVDIFVDGGPLKFLGNTTVDCSVAKGVFASVEAGATNFGVSGKVGIGAVLPVPGMIFAKATVYPLVKGDDRPQVKLTWLSKDLKLGKGVAVYAAGFARFRDKAPDVAQPQLWLKIDGMPFEVGGKAAIFGKKTDFYIGIKRNF